MLGPEAAEGTDSAGVWCAAAGVHGTGGTAPELTGPVSHRTGVPAVSVWKATGLEWQ